MTFVVQMEVVLPAVMTVQESHDIAIVLQHKVESFDEVERAFVHGKSASCNLRSFTQESFICMLQVTYSSVALAYLGAILHDLGNITWWSLCPTHRG